MVLTSDGAIAVYAVRYRRTLCGSLSSVMALVRVMSASALLHTLQTSARTSLRRSCKTLQIQQLQNWGR